MEAPRLVGHAPVLAVGGDGGGNLFLLGLRSPFAVWKWDHEIGTATQGQLPDDHEALTWVCDGVVDFLARIAEDWQHFVRGDDDWEYLAG